MCLCPCFFDKSFRDYLDFTFFPWYNCAKKEGICLTDMTPCSQKIFDNKITVMTFNTQHCLNYLTGKIDFSAMAETILKFSPDIVGLNEMRGKGENPEYTAQTEKLAELCGMPFFYFAKALDVGGKNPYGNAILSKIPIISAETMLVPEPLEKIEGKHYEQRCVLNAKLPNGMTVLVTHFGLSPEEQINSVKVLGELITDKRCILMGDFNVTPDSDIIIPIREKMKDTADSFSTPDLLSFPSDKPHCKIDYIFVSHDIKVDFADIPDVVASDHRPHIAHISL